MSTTTTNLPILPDVIINHICEFNADHRPHFLKSLQRISMTPTLKDLPLKALKHNMERIITQFDHQIHEVGNWDFYSLLRKNIADPDHWLRTYAKCRCCKRHQRRRPCHLRDYGFRKQAPVPEPKFSHIPDIHDCRCNCRHSARFIFKSMHNRFENGEPFTQSWLDSDDDFSVTESDDETW